MVHMKTCTACREARPLDQFYRSRGTKDGLQYVCKVCSKAKAKAWRLANPDRHKESVRRWARNNPEKRAEYMRRYFERNPDKIASFIKRQFGVDVVIQ